MLAPQGMVRKCEQDGGTCALLEGDKVALETRGPTLEGLEFQDESSGLGLRDLVPGQMSDKVTRTAGESGLQAVSRMLMEKEHGGGSQVRSSCAAPGRRYRCSLADPSEHSGLFSPVLSPLPAARGGGVSLSVAVLPSPRLTRETPHLPSPTCSTHSPVLLYWHP